MDDEGDVSLASADLLGAAVYTDGELADFRLQFAAPPFTDQATYSISWCLDYGPGGTGTCSTHATGVDAYLRLHQEGAAGQFLSTTSGVDACEHASFDPVTNSLRVLVPLDVLPVAPEFTWIVTVTFGGSFGTNEWIPEVGSLPVTAVEIFPPFVGDPSC